MSQTSGSIKIDFKYIANNASWKPYYEIRGENTQSPLIFSLNAIVKQKTGVNWRGVKLTLVNGNFYQNHISPKVEPWFLYTTPPYKDENILQTEKIQVSKEIKEEVLVATNIHKLTTSYESNSFYNILSNYEEHQISLNKQKIPVEFQYFTAPNYRRQAYLLAKIKDFNKYDLLRTKANILFEGIYIGETDISPNSIDNELSITIGNDDKISIKRENIKEKTGERFLSSYLEKEITYDLIIKNNKKESIDINVQDRFPLSKDEAVKVELLESSGASKNDEKGFLNWNISLLPSEIKKLRVSYKIRYPKGYHINL